MTAWRDVDSSRAAFGVQVYATGLTVWLGHRCYRVRWASR